MSILGQFRKIGLRVALDDFDTGYTSLAYLQKFKFNKLRIDRSFVSGLATSEESRIIFSALVGIGRNLNMRITAKRSERRNGTAT